MTENKIIRGNVGWSKLYNPVIDDVLKYDDAQTNFNDKIGIKSIESVYGVLEIKLYHYQNASQQLLDKIRKAEEESARTCSLCGDVNHIGITCNDDEYCTCCEECWRKYIKPYHSHSKWKDFLTNNTYK